MTVTPPPVLQTSGKKSEPAVPGKEDAASDANKPKVKGASEPPVFEAERNECYCICGRPNDDRPYILCEDNCQWYHPDCVGFDTETVCDNPKVKFICPFCKADTKNEYNKLVEKGLYRKVNSRLNQFVGKYFAILPVGV